MMGWESDIRMKFLSWFGWSRPPFHTIGVVPYFLGAFLAWRLTHAFNIVIFILGLCGILLVMVSTYHAGTYFGDRDDERARHPFHSRYAFLTGKTTYGLDSRLLAHLRISIVAILLAGIIGLVLQFGLNTGACTLFLGILGALPGFTYSIRPVRLVETGFGELFISVCYGWLPEASAFYIQRGYIPPYIHWMALPIGLSIFNVILLKEFRDYAADLALGRTNLLIRLGRTKGALLYGAVSILSWLSLHASLSVGVPRKALYIYLPVMALSAFVSVMMARKKYDSPLFLELLSGLNITVNLGTTAAYILAFL